MYRARTLIVLEDIYGPDWIYRLPLDEGVADALKGWGRNLALAGGMALASFGGAGSAQAQERPDLPQQQPQIQQQVQQQSTTADQINKATMDYHQGAHTQNVRQNVLGSPAWEGIYDREASRGQWHKLPGSFHQEVNQRLSQSDPSASRSNWSKDDHKTLSAAQLRWQAHVDSARNPQEKAERLATAGKALHGTINSIHQGVRERTIRDQSRPGSSTVQTQTAAPAKTQSQPTSKAEFSKTLDTAFHAGL